MSLWWCTVFFSHSLKEPSSPRLGPTVLFLSRAFLADFLLYRSHRKLSPSPFFQHTVPCIIRGSPSALILFCEIHSHRRSTIENSIFYRAEFPFGRRDSMLYCFQTLWLTETMSDCVESMQWRNYWGSKRKCYLNLGTRGTNWALLKQIHV